MLHTKRGFTATSDPYPYDLKEKMQYIQNRQRLPANTYCKVMDVSYAGNQYQKLNKYRHH